jgi:hypothetical protein
LLPPQHIKPYVKRGKNDANDAEVICEAMSRPGMRFVPIKSAQRQAELMLLGVRDLLIKQRTRIVLACLEGKRNDEVSRELGVRPNTVGLWRKRFAVGGIARLRDQARPGKKPNTEPSCASASCGNWNCRGRQGGRLGWRFAGRGPRRLGRRGLARVAPQRHSVAPASLVVRQHRPAICRQSGRYYWLVAEPCGTCAGPQRRREAVDSGPGTGHRLCSDEQR